jgi:hypothetical protein
MTKAKWILGSLVLVAGLLAASAVSAAENMEGLSVGPIEYHGLTDSPVSGSVEMFVVSNHPTATRGSFTEVFLVVKNHSNDATVSVNIELELKFADGQPVRPFHLGRDRIHTLGPDEGVGFFLYFAVPEDAELGTASFAASARIGRVTGGDDGHAQNTNPMIASDSIEFEVVP